MVKNKLLDHLIIYFFPKSFKLPESMAPSRLYKQAGNSVCVSVIQRIADNLTKVLDS